MSHRGQRILIIGAGELGRSILNGYAKHPSRPRLSVLLRPTSDKLSRQSTLDVLKKQGANPVYLDLTAPISDLIAVFESFDIVISCAGMSAPPGTEERLCTAAIQAQVGRYIPWQFGVDYDQYDDNPIVEVFKESQRVRRTLRSQRDIKWTIISTGVFTSFIFEPVVGIFQPGQQGKAVVRGLGSWERKITVTSVEDIGRLTALITLGETGEAGENEAGGAANKDGVVFVVGDTVTYADIAKSVQALGWNVQKELWTEAELLAQLEKDDNAIVRYRIMCARGLGMSWNKQDSWNGRREGVQVENLVDWTERCLPRP